MSKSINKFFWRNYSWLDLNSYELHELGHMFVLKSQNPLSGCPRFNRLAVRLGTFFCIRI